MTPLSLSLSLSVSLTHTESCSFMGGLWGLQYFGEENSVAECQDRLGFEF